MVFHNPLCLKESGGPISLSSIGILYKKPFAISSLTFGYFIMKCVRLNLINHLVSFISCQICL